MQEKITREFVHISIAWCSIEENLEQNLYIYIYCMNLIYIENLAEYGIE